MKHKSQSLAQSPSPRLAGALALSLLLHLGLLAGAHMPSFVPSVSSSSLTAQLERLPPIEVDEVLKNTLDDPPAPPKPVQPTDRSSGGRKPAPPMEALQRRLSDMLFYPPEALQSGWEGEVVLFIEFDAQGRIVEVIVGASSGYAVLDEAAAHTVRSLGPFPGAPTGRAVAFPVRYRLP